MRHVGEVPWTVNPQSMQQCRRFHGTQAGVTGERDIFTNGGAVYAIEKRDSRFGRRVFKNVVVRHV